MSETIKDIKNRIKKLERLTGFNYCQCCKLLSKSASEQEWIKAWNIDNSIIEGMINDMELYCGTIANDV